MATEFGGEYSPGAQGNQKEAQAKRAQSSERKSLKRLRLLRFLAFPIAIGGALKILDGDAFAALGTIGCAVALMFAFEVTKAGILAEQAYNARAIARRPAWPRKTIGGLLAGAAFGLLGLINGNFGALGALGIGIFGFVGMIMSYGIDPLKNKGMTGRNPYQAERAAEAINKATLILGEIRDMAKSFSDRRLKLRIDELAISAEEMFQTIENDPQDYRDARRYLSVYLKGARDATAQYLALPSPEMAAQSQKYQNLIEELNAGFQKTRKELLEDKADSLDIEIDVLRERLALEGITIAKEE